MIIYHQIFDWVFVFVEARITLFSILTYIRLRGQGTQKSPSSAAAELKLMYVKCNAMFWFCYNFQTKDMVTDGCDVFGFDRKQCRASDK